MCTIVHGTSMSQTFLSFLQHVNLLKPYIFTTIFNHSFLTYNIFTILFTVWL